MIRLRSAPLAALLALFGWVCATPFASGQFLGDGGPGIRFNSVSAYSSFTPIRSTVPNSPSWGIATGVTGSLGWSKTLERGALSVGYGGGYGRQVQSQYSAQIFHSLAANFDRTLSPRLDFSMSTNATYSDAESYLFRSSLLTTAPRVVTGPDLTAGTLLTPADILDSPANYALFGSRVLTSSFGTSIAFRKSPRLSYVAALGAGISTRLNGADSGGSLARSLYTNVNGAVHYTLTSRVTIGATVAASRGYSHIRDAYAMHASFFASRRMTSWWRLNGSVGVGTIVPVRQGFSQASDPRIVGSLGSSFTGLSQTLSLGVSTTVFDPYGVGAGNTVTASAFWVLHRNRSKWSVSANFVDSISRRTTGETFSSWRASATFGRVLTDRLYWSVSGGYADFYNNIPGLTTAALPYSGRALQGVRTAITWSPNRLIW